MASRGTSVDDQEFVYVLVYGLSAVSIVLALCLRGVLFTTVSSLKQVEGQFNRMFGTVILLVIFSLMCGGVALETHYPKGWVHGVGKDVRAEKVASVNRNNLLSRKNRAPMFDFPRIRLTTILGRWCLHDEVSRIWECH